MPFTEIENAVAAIARGELVIVVDDADRENEGDLSSWRPRRSRPRRWRS